MCCAGTPATSSLRWHRFLSFEKKCIYSSFGELVGWMWLVGRFALGMDCEKSGICGLFVEELTFSNSFRAGVSCKWTNIMVASQSAHDIHDGNAGESMDYGCCWWCLDWWYLVNVSVASSISTTKPKRCNIRKRQTANGSSRCFSSLNILKMKAIREKMKMFHWIYILLLLYIWQ